MRRGVQALFFIVVLVVVVGVAALGASIRVDRDEVLIDDNNRCSLREAIINANTDTQAHDDCEAGNGADTLILQSSDRRPATYILPDGPGAFDADGSNGLPSITSEILIEGNFATIARDENLVCMPNGTKLASEFRVMHVGTSGDLTLRNTTISNGCAESTGPPTSLHAGGIFNNGTVLIESSTISNNIATGFGGGIFNSSTGTLTLSSSTVESNLAQNGPGGGIENQGMATIQSSSVIDNDAANGGGIENSDSATLLIEDSLISGNAATSGGGITNVGGASGLLTIRRSTITDNRSTQKGGGIYNFLNSILTLERNTIDNNTAGTDGGGIAASNDTLSSLINSTISGNSAVGNGGGIWNASNGVLKIENGTTYGNAAADGGGVFNSATTEVKNSIVAMNVPNNCSNSATFTEFGVNFTDDPTCVIDMFFEATTAELNLGPLADNGGPTQTHALLPGSVAIDAVTDCTDIEQTTPIDEDQRERDRAFPFGGNCDAGAYEFRYEYLETRSRGSLGFNVNVMCGEREEFYMLNSTPFTSVVEYNTDVEIIFPLTRTSANPITADINNVFNLIEPAGYLAAGRTTLPVQTQLESGGAYHLDCNGIRTFPTSIDSEFDPDEPVVNEILKQLVGEADFFRGILGIETDQRDIRVFATTTERVLRCIGDPINDNCFEEGVNETRVEITSTRISNSRTEVFTQSFESSIRTLAGNSAIQFTAQAVGLTELGIEIYGLNARAIYSATSNGNSLVWRMRDNAGRAVASGVYLYIVTAKDTHGNVVRSGVKKLVVMR